MNYLKDIYIFSLNKLLVLGKYFFFTFIVHTVIDRFILLQCWRLSRESVAQSKSTRSQKAKLSTIECDHQWVTIIILYTRLFTHPKISPESNSEQTLQKSFR